MWSKKERRGNKKDEEGSGLRKRDEERRRIRRRRQEKREEIRQIIEEEEEWEGEEKEEEDMGGGEREDKNKGGEVEKEVKGRLAQERSHPDVSITHDAPLQERDTHCVFAEVWDVCVCVVSSL